MSQPFILAQLSDLHVTERGEKLGGVIDTNVALGRAVARLRAFRPAAQALIITGDLTESGQPGQYDALQWLLAPLSMPIYVIPGNHDARQTLRQAVEPGWLPGDGPFVQYAVDLGPLRLVALDTVQEGEAGGMLDAPRLDWLDRTLGAAPQRPTVIAMHHPPVDTGIGFMDRIGLEGRTQVARILSAHSQVERVICGHIHRSVQARLSGTVVSVCPGTAHQVCLALDAEQADAWVPEPPAFQLHVWTGGRLVTHTVPVEDAGPPRAFGDE